MKSLEFARFLRRARRVAFLTLFSLTAAAAPAAKFGPEFTFTNPKLVNAAKEPRQSETEENRAAQALWFKRVSKVCKVTRACTVTPTQDKHGRNAFRVTYQDGWWYQVELDVAVLEIQTKPGTVEDFKKLEKRIQHDIFDFAKEMSLSPHERIGGGHISIGLDAFEANAPLFRDFLVDTANHPELTYGIFGNHLGNAPPVSALPPESQEAFKKVIRDFDHDPGSIQALAKKIETEVYTSNPFDWNWDTAYYQNARLSSVYDNIPAELRRIEVRGFRPQPSARAFVLETELLQRRIDYLRARRTRVSPKIPPYSTTYAEKRWRFQRYLREMGQTEEKYREVIPPKFLKVEPSKEGIPYHESHVGESVRPAYARAEAVYQSLHAERIDVFSEKAKEIGSDNRALLPIPRVLTQKEHHTLIQGTEQRGRALWEFYRDIATGEHRAVKAGIISKEVVKRILRKSELDEVMSFPLEHSAAYYGPDIARGPDGKFVVIEDNFGHLGGMADATQSRHDLLKLLPKYQEVFTAEKGRSFAEIIVKQLDKIAAPRGGEKIFLLSQSDFEHSRYFIEHLKAHGVRVYAAEELVKSDLIDSSSGEVRLTTPEGEKRVGGIILRGLNMNWLRLQFPNTYKAYKQGKVAMIGTDMHEMLGDKELLQYVDQLTEFYLKEKPLLPSLETRSFRKIGKAGETVLDDPFIRHVFQNLPDWVIKDTQGAQGDSVWIGRRMDPDSVYVDQLFLAVKDRPGRFIAQKYTPISVLDDHLVDLRVLSVVSDKGVRASDRIWGRAVHVSGDGRVNMSQKGGGVAVFADGIDTVPEGSVHIVDPESEAIAKRIASNRSFRLVEEMIETEAQAAAASCLKRGLRGLGGR